MNEDIKNTTNIICPRAPQQRQECLVYSRVVWLGWLTPVKNYNPGKAEEFKSRKNFIIDNKTDN